VREKLATLPNPTLKIGVDPSQATEKTAAETALTSVLQTTRSSGQPINRVQVVPLHQQSQVEYILARTTQAMQDQLSHLGVSDL
ncbi:hypothetical protein, partial [Haemophilus parainfluenzae]|uniref:hypothetical protein n=1 Tax=Haemophilus parainfluenzae TaxID=729 RepID=UPI001788E229